MSRDLYEILEVDRSATTAEIKSAYRKLAVKYHPDKTDDQSLNQRFLEIKQAYEILSDEYKRNLYDLTQSEVFANNYEELKKDTYRRPPPPFVVYQTQKVEFSPRTYFYGFLFVLGIIALAIALPVVLMTRSANIHFEKGLQYYHSGMYSEAIDHFTIAVNDLGGKSGMANYYNAYILFHEYNNYRITIKYINESLEDIDNDSIASELFWMKGRCYEEANLFDEALKYYQNVRNFSSAYDSAMLHKGIIFSVNKNNYALGTIYFDSLLNKNRNNYVAKYFKAYSLQKMNEHYKALQLFEEIEEESDYASGSVYLHKAQSELKLDMKDIACEDLQKAINLNSADAKKLYEIYCN